MSEKQLIHQDAWQSLREATNARIALGRAGASLPTQPWLDFKLAHARARDAVHIELDLAHLNKELAPMECDTVVANTAAPDRATYLRRPDLGARLADPSRAGLKELADKMTAKPDLSIILSDGLTAFALQEHAASLLQCLLPILQKEDWTIAPLVIAPLARVALQDEIGELFGARLALILLGERPGLDSPDSLGAYLVFNPGKERTNADRNCVSNIRTAGLAPNKAADAIAYLLRQARHQGRSGITLKDDRQVIDSYDVESLPPAE